jgi:hypothetical protein
VSREHKELDSKVFKVHRVFKVLLEFKEHKAFKVLLEFKEHRASRVF